MQATHYVPDEVEPSQRGRREPTFFEYHADFVEEVLGEKRRLVAEALDESQTVWQGLMVHTKHKRWVWGIWAMELMWMLFMLMANTMEIWGTCPYQMRVSAACLYCYSRPFLAWSFILVTFWGMDLFLSMLLVSRGFQFTWSRGVDDASAKEIPRRAVALFFALLAVLGLTLLAGGLIMIMSSSCGSAPQYQERSSLMFFTTLATLVGLPLLVALGRMEIC